MSGVEQQFEVIVRKDGDTFFLYSREWHLLVEGTDLSQAYEQIKNEQSCIRERYGRAGLERELPVRPSTSRFSLGRILELNLVATVAKTLLICVTVSVFVFLGSLALFEQVQLGEKIQKLTSPPPGIVGKFATGVIEKIARSMEELTPERREEIRKSLQTITRELESLKNESRSSVGEVSQGPLTRQQ